MLKKQREKRGITQAELAKKLGVTQEAVTKWETGRNKPRASTLIKLAEILDCSVDELLKEEKEAG